MPCRHAMQTRQRELEIVGELNKGKEKTERKEKKKKG